MTGVMDAKMVRLVVDVSEEARDALKMEALLRDEPMGNVIEELIQTHLTEALAQIRERRERRNPPDHPPKGRKS